MLLALLVACTGHADSVAPPTPRVSFLSPAEGRSGECHTVYVWIAVTDFLLSPPAKQVVDEPEGYLHLTWTDGTTSGTLDTTDTTREVEVNVASGTLTITADLLFPDGSPVSDTFPDFVPASVHVECIYPEE